MPELQTYDSLQNNDTAPVPKILRALAALEMPNYRAVRYIGDDRCVRMTELAKRDRYLLTHFYDVLTALLLVITDTSSDDDERWMRVIGWTVRHDLSTIFDNLRELGIASHAQHASEELAKAMHDVRGGALSALLGRLQLIDRLPRNEANLQTLFVLARDHHKIMRSAIIGLDDARREEDHLPKSHAMRLLVEKWHESVVGPKWNERPIRLYIDCRHEGAASECCLESAALDRIFYNLVNNACRHCAGDRLDMMIFPAPGPLSKCLRFVLSNPVGAGDADFLRGLSQTGSDSNSQDVGLSLEGLFAPEVSSTGSGFGLTVVADFVTGAFGLRDRAQALKERYVGAVLDGDVFRAWFHWPVANDSLPPKLDDYHQPALSLSGG